MSPEEFYGKAYPQLRLAQERLLALISSYPEKEDAVSGIRQIESCCSRIKSPESMAGKLRRMGLSPTAYNALTQVHDALGLRVICAFTDDIYRVARWLEKQEELEVIKIKDYLAFPKPNGYRSYHMIIKVREGAGAGVTAEIQIRTIALDFWASLEHQIKYKRSVHSESLIRQELKRCADEIASVDLSMQAIRDFILEPPPSPSESSESEPYGRMP